MGAPRTATQHTFLTFFRHGPNMPPDPPLPIVKQLRWVVRNFCSCERCCLNAERGGQGGLTDAGQGLGTPDYIAPEQIRDARTADARADIYSLGGTFHFLLTGRPPFPDGNATQKMAAHLEKQPTPLSHLRPDLPAALVQLVERMMTKDAVQRYQSAAAVVAALEPWCRPSGFPQERSAALPKQSAAGVRRRRKTLAMVAAIVIILIAGIVAAYWR
jgi:serine/threonine protein kinase